MSELAEDFVRGSQALEGEGGLPPAQCEALDEARRLGEEGRPLSADQLRAWATALGEPLDAAEAEGHAAWLRARFGEVVGRPWLARGRDPQATVEALAETLERFGPTTRLGRWGCAWAAELLARPLLVFRGKDAQALAGGPARLRLLVAGKLRVASYDLGRRRGGWVGGDAAAGRYQAEGGAEWIVEWHELLPAEARWRAEASASSS